MSSMMDFLKGELSADSVTQLIPNFLRSGGGEDTSWMGKLYEVMEQDTTSLDVDLMYTNLSFCFDDVPEYEPRGAFVEVPEPLLTEFPGVLLQPYLIMERVRLSPDKLQVQSTRGGGADVFFEKSAFGLFATYARPARLLYVVGEVDFDEDSKEYGTLLRLNPESKSVWSMEVGT